MNKPVISSAVTHHIELPFDEAGVRALNLGDSVYLSGEIVISAGLPTYQRIVDYLEQDQPLPIDMNGAAFFQLGSYSEEIDGRFEVRYMNPTTSTRFNPLMPTMIRALKLRAVGGKGGLDAQSVAAMQEVGCVYLSFLGGGCALLSEAIRSVVSVHWEDMISHYRLVTLRVENLGPATVAIDAHGNSLYDQLHDEAEKRLPEILAALKLEREGANS